MRMIRLPRSDDTFALGEALGRSVEPGTVIAVRGDLGAGKTLLAKGIGAGLAVPTSVQSPTYVIVHLHPSGRLPLWHADLYRLSGEEELEQLGVDEAIEGDGVVVIEWPDRVEGWLPADRLDILLEHDGEGRVATLSATGPRHRVLEAVDV